MVWKKRVNKILRRFPSWWKKDSDSNTFGLIKSFSNEYDEFSTESNNMKSEVYVNTSTGTYLDDLAKIFKLSRKPGETDNQLRARIKAYWPGFSGGGTKYAIKSTINKMTGVPESNITLTEIPNQLKFNLDVLLSTQADLQLIPTIHDVVWDIKAAGVYPFITWVVNGDMLHDYVQIGDAVTITVVGGDIVWFWDISKIDGEAVWQ